MALPATSDLVAQALLRYFRDPVQHRAEMLHANEVSANLDLVLRLALGRPVEFTEPALRIPGIARELARAALFFVGQTLAREDASHYQILGLTPEASADAIRENHRLLIQLVHPDRHNSGTAWPVTVAARVNRAYSVLKNAQTRAAYDKLRADAQSKREAAVRRAASFSVSAGGIVRKRTPFRPPVLPEWLTAGVGGFVRHHPAFTIFAGLISLSALSIGGILWSERGGTLTRDDAAAGDTAVPSPRFNVLQPITGAKAPQGAPEAPAIAIGNQALLTSAKPDALLPPMALNPRPVRDPARPPITNLGSRLASEFAMVTPSRPESGGGARTSERPASPGPGVAAAAKALISNETTPLPPRSVAPRDQPTAATEPAAPASVPALAASQPTVRSDIAEIPVPPPVVPLALAPSPPPAPAPATPAAVIATVVPAKLLTAPSRGESAAAPSAQAPSSAEVEALIAAFISYYEGGRLDAFASLFDIDARTDEFRGRDAIRGDYGELFRRSGWRRISVRRLQWRAAGERTEATGEIAVKIGWRDGREVEQRIALNMELMRQDGRTVIARLSQQVRN